MARPVPSPTETSEQSGGIVVFARSPERGRVKTRLARTLGDDAALALHRAFLADTLEACRRSGARVLLAHTPGPAPAEVAQADVAFEQRGESFGERVDAALREARERLGAGPLLVVAMDTPHVGPERLRAALERLAAAPALLGPSPGGGFWLLGFAGAQVPLAPAFAADNECAAVARLLARAGCAPALFDFTFDVDVERDLVELLCLLETRASAGTGWLPAHTLRAIASLALRVVPSPDGAAGAGSRALELAIGDGRAR